MPRYIDADALIDDIRKHSESYFADDFAHEWVDKQPSADVKPIRHGRWTLQEDRTKKLYGWHICSECGAWIGEPTNYCSNCGADMRGESK